MRRIRNVHDYEALQNLEIPFCFLLGPEPWEDVPFENSWVIFSVLSHLHLVNIVNKVQCYNKCLHNTCIVKFPFPLQEKEKPWHIHYLLNRQGIKKKRDSGNKRKWDTIICLKGMSKITKKQQLRNVYTARQFFP